MTENKKGHLYAHYAQELQCPLVMFITRRCVVSLGNIFQELQFVCLFFLTLRNVKLF